MIAGPAHLKALEAESIRIFREIAAQSVRPVMLYSIGKDSSVLLHLARKAFFHPSTKGSSSIKKVLPAVMAESAFLRERYSKPVYGTAEGTLSLNFVEQCWWQERDGVPVSPYDLLPKVFDDMPTEAMNDLEGEGDMEIAEGGAATTAWARFQFEEASTMENDKVAAALRRYCELDTLAMVMIYEAWREWAQ